MILPLEDSWPMVYKTFYKLNSTVRAWNLNCLPKNKDFLINCDNAGFTDFALSREEEIKISDVEFTMFINVINGWHLNIYEHDIFHAQLS